MVMEMFMLVLFVFGFSGIPNISGNLPEMNWEEHHKDIWETQKMNTAKGGFDSLNVRFVGNWPFGYS